VNFLAQNALRNVNSFGRAKFIELFRSFPNICENGISRYHGRVSDKKFLVVLWCGLGEEKTHEREKLLIANQQSASLQE
jgi:hypothetical protein